jgi:hypothetical protein
LPSVFSIGAEYVAATANGKITQVFEDRNSRGFVVYTNQLHNRFRKAEARKITKSAA